MFHPTVSNSYILQILPIFFSFLDLFQVQIVETIEKDFAVVDNTVMGFKNHILGVFTTGLIVLLDAGVLLLNLLFYLM